MVFGFLLIVVLPFFLTVPLELEFYNKGNNTILVLNEGVGNSNSFDVFFLDPGKSRLVNLSNWSGFIWAGTHCDKSTEICLTGHCGDEASPRCDDYILNTRPYTYVDFVYNKAFYWYGVSLARGFNLPISIEPVSDENCKTVSCNDHLNEACPVKYRLTHKNTTIGCHSPCTLTQRDEFCCIKRYTDNVCRSVLLPDDYEDFYRSRCPAALIYTDEILLSKCVAKKFIINFS